MSEFLQPLVIRASAGSGKTYQLSNRYLQLLFLQVDPSKILATTFTRKAAGEIFERVLSRLSLAAQDASQAQALAAALEMEITQQEAAMVLRRLIFHQYRTQIATLDSFFLSLFTSFAPELGLSPGWKLRDDEEESYFWERCISQFAYDLAQDRSLLELLQTALGGSLKRSVHQSLHAALLSFYALYLESNKNGPAWGEAFHWEEIQPFPFDEMIELWSSFPMPLTKKGEKDKRWQRAHDSTSFVLKQRSEDALFALVDAGLLKAYVEKGSFFSTAFTTEQEEIVEEILSEARVRIHQRQRKETYALYETLQSFEKVVQSVLIEEGLPGFQDVKHILGKLSDFGLLQSAYYRLDTRVSHVLFDEFQDTSFQEFRLLQPFIEELLPEVEEKKKSFFCVGDVKQAIYGWRGGSSQILSNISELLHFDFLVEEMDTTRRNAHGIIEVMNAIFSDLESLGVSVEDLPYCRSFFKLYNPHSSAREADAYGYVTFSQVPGRSEDKDRRQEKTVLHRIQEIREKDATGSIGILVRKNEAVIRLTDCLRSAGYSVTNVGGRSLSESPAVGIVCALLRYLDSPGEEVCRFHVEQQIPELFAENRTWDYWRFQLYEHGYAALFASCFSFLESRLYEDDRGLFQRLLAVGTLLDARQSLRPRDAVRFIEHYKVQGVRDRDIQIMTIHQSKGLAFDHVILAAMDVTLVERTKVPPLVYTRSKDNGYIETIMKTGTKQTRLLDSEQAALYESVLREQAEESLCLFYVALTRARDGLHLISTPSEKGTSQTSWASLARLGLQKFFDDVDLLTSNEVHVEHGFDEWQAKESIVEEIHPIPERFLPEGKEVLAKPYQDFHWDTASAHGVSSNFQPMKFDSQTGTQFGTRIHASLEQVSWIDGEAVYREQVEAIVRACGHSISTEVANVLSRYLNDDRIKPLYNPETFKEKEGDRVDVFNEYALMGTVQGRYTSAIIDRLISVSDSKGILKKLFIYDYKSDSFDADDESARVLKLESYRPQMESYRELLASASNLPEDSIFCFLVFLRIPELVEL